MRVLLKMCLCGSVRGSTSKPPCSLSDITAQQSMTGAKATSKQGYVENIIHLPAPLFILSTQRVWLLFHKWRRHTAVITSHCSPHPFCAVWLLHAGSDWKSLLSWVTLFLVLNCVIHEASSGFLSREAPIRNNVISILLPNQPQSIEASTPPKPWSWAVVSGTKKTATHPLRCEVRPPWISHIPQMLS